jgi:hypothetical protein
VGAYKSQTDQNLPRSLLNLFREVHVGTVASKPTHAKPIKLPYSVGRGFG